MKLLSNIQERIERSIYEKIRLLCVEQGYSADVTNFMDDIADTQAFKEKLAEIKQEKGFAIEVFGFSGSQHKGVMKTPRIVLITRRVLPTGVGLPTTYQFIPDPNSDKFLKLNLDGQFQQMIVEIQLVSSKAKQDRVLHQIIGAALGSRGYLHFHDKQHDCETFFIEQFSYFDNQNTEEGIMTKYYQYRVDNISIFNGEVDMINKIAKIREITVETHMAETMPITGSAQEDTDLGNTEIGDTIVRVKPVEP